MAAIPGIRFDITGASGSQGLLTPKSGWRCYVLPRGGYVSQNSTGTLLTFDSAAIAGRFAALDWIQAGLSAANIRQVAAVAGNSLSVSGAALTVSENDRIYIIGSTEPTISGGSVTYSTPATTIRQRDDDGSTRYTNSMVTTNADGLVQFFSTPAVYDCVIQDGNRALQGSLIDVPVGVAEGLSTSQASVFGATVTFNAVIGVTGWATFGQTVTMNAALGVTGWATFGSTVTMNANAGVTGTFVVGATSTFTGKAAFGNSVSVDGALGVTGHAAFGTTITIVGTSGNYSHSGAVTMGNSLSVTTDVRLRRILATRGTSITTASIGSLVGWGASASVTLAGGNAVRGLFDITALGAGITANPTCRLTWPAADGSYASSSRTVILVRGEANAPVAATWTALGTGVISTGVDIQFIGTPVSGTAYECGYVVIG